MTLATVPMRCRSTGSGSATSRSRCIRSPICRCSRTACWAAAIERSRPTVTGMTTPGNSVMSRTGMMAMASEGNGGRVAVCRSPDDPVAPLVSISATCGLHFFQHHQQTTVGRGAANIVVAPVRQAQPALEAALRQLEAMDDGGRELGGKRPRTHEHELWTFDPGLDTIGVDARKRHDHENLALGLEHVDRRLPCGRARAREHGLE